MTCFNSILLFCGRQVVHNRCRFMICFYVFLANLGLRGRREQRAATSWARWGGGGALHAMTTPSEVDGSRRWTPRAARHEIGVGAAQDGARAARQSRRADGAQLLWADDAMKVVVFTSGENILFSFEGE
jgi:hypothetical protein